MELDILLEGFPGKAERGFLGWCNIVMIHTPEGSMLVDTGCHGDRSMLLAALAKRNIAPASIKRLLITHLHFDHCLNADLFPHAEIIIGRREWEYANSSLPEERNDVFVPRQYLPYLASRKPQMVSEGDNLFSGVRVLELPGHTPGCVGLLLEGGLVLAGDAVKNACDFANRDPGLVFDTYENGVASLERVAALAQAVLPGHDSLFTLAAGQIKERNRPTVRIQHYADGQAARTVILGGGDDDDQ